MGLLLFCVVIGREKRAMTSIDLAVFEGSLQLQQLCLDVLEPIDDLKTLVHTITVGSQLRLSGIELETFLLDQVMNLAYHLDVVWGVESDVLGVALGLDNGELRLPIAQCALGDAHNQCHIAYLIVLLVKFLHIVSSIWCHNKVMT